MFVAHSISVIYNTSIISESSKCVVVMQKKPKDI